MVYVCIDLFAYSAPVSSRRETRSRLGWIISLKSLSFVTPSLQLVALFTEMQERSIVINAEWVSSETGDVMTKADAEVCRDFQIKRT